MGRSLIASDAFNRAGPGLGSDWANLSTGRGDVVINSSTKVTGQFGVSANDHAAARWVGAGTFSNDQYASVKVQSLTSFAGANDRVGVIVRASADTDGTRDYYLVTADADSATSTHSVRLSKWVNGTFTSLHQGNTTLAENDRLELEAEGTTIRVCVNGTALGGSFTVTDSDLSTGKPGIATAGNASCFGDDWEGGDVTAAAAPVLSSPTGAATGNTTANAGATIDAVSGSGSRIMYALPRIGGSAASAATIISTGTQLAVTTAGAKSVPLTGLTNGASYSADVVYVDATTGESNVVTSSWTQTAAPVLSSPTNTPGSTTALIGATTDVTSGTAYFLPRVGGSAASAATIIATGQTSTVTTTTPSRTVTGLTASTANNYVDIVQVSGVTTSNVVSTGAFTTTASGDTTPPTLTGSIVIGTVTSSSIQMSWSAGSDNVGVTSYEVSKDGGSNYIDAGLVLTYTFTGLTASTSYPLRVRAKDAAGNVSTPALSATQSTAAASGVGSINLNNAIYTFKTNNGTPLASLPVTFYVSDVSTGALVGSAITGLSTNASAILTTAISNASMLAGTTYTLRWKFSGGEIGIAELPAI